MVVGGGRLTCLLMGVNGLPSLAVSSLVVIMQSNDNKTCQHYFVLLHGK